MAQQKGEQREVYFSEMQQRIYYCRAKDIRLVAPRRAGKSHIMGTRAKDVAASQPRGAGGWGGSSKKQLFTRTVPGTLSAIAATYGYQEGLQFGPGKPPKSVPTCIIKPKSYENVIWFANGFLWHLVSASVVGSSNGFTFNSWLLDECKFMRESTVREEFEPCLSGIVHPMGDPRFSELNPLYKSTMYVSDASLRKKGSWLEKEDAKLDMTVDSGPFEGKTYREVQQELDEHISRVMFFNRLIRNAKKTKHRVIPVSDEEKERIQLLAQAVMERRDQFKILAPNWAKPIGETTVKTLLNYKLITEDDAELLFNHEYLITHDDYWQMQAMRVSKKYQDHITDLQRSCFYFYRPTGLVNLQLLGADYYAKMKRDLPPLVYMISILNVKPTKTLEGFYQNLDIENIHGYIPEDCPAIDKSITVKKGKEIIGGTMYGTEYEAPDFDYLGALKDCSTDGDCIDDLPLYVALDYGNLINWIITAQVYRRPGSNSDSMNVLSAQFVKDGQMVQDLIRQWAEYYAPHRRKNRTVYYFYDHTAKFKPHGVYVDDIKDTVLKELRKYGYDAVGIDMGQTVSHLERWKAINESLAEISYPHVRINRENCEALILAMENCGTRQGVNGLTKDKSGEKLNPDNLDGSSTPVELRTDGTDAFDSLFIGIKYHRMKTSFLMTPGGR